MWGSNYDTCLVIADFVRKFSNFRYHGNKDRSRVNYNDTVKLAKPENLVWCRNLGYISYASRVIANFVLLLNFVFKCNQLDYSTAH